MKGITLICFLFASLFVRSQVALSIADAEKQGITIAHLDSIYKSAVHSDAHKAVFKTDAQVQKLTKAYQDFLLGLGVFLDKNHFKWEENTRGWNRIYMKPNGSVDYFLYALKDVPAAKEKEFNRLLNLYIKSHKFGITAPVKFAQCSPVTYPKSE